MRAAPLPDGERDRNLEMLRFISAETARRGLHFQLGLWTHAYQWIDSPNANYRIEGLSAERHAPYCRDALAELLRACPEIGGLGHRFPRPHHPFEHDAAALLALVDSRFDGMAAQRFLRLLALAQ